MLKNVGQPRHLVPEGAYWCQALYALDVIGAQECRESQTWCLKVPTGAGTLGTWCLMVPKNARQSWIVPTGARKSQHLLPYCSLKCQALLALGAQSCRMVPIDAWHSRHVIVLNNTENFLQSVCNGFASHLTILK